MGELPPQPFVAFSYPFDLQIAATHLAKDLQALGINVWTYEDMWPGDNIREETEKAIQAAGALILLFFPVEQSLLDDRLSEELQIAHMSQRPVLSLLNHGVTLADLVSPSLLPQHFINISGSNEEEELALIIQALESLGFTTANFPIRIRIIQEPLTAQNLTLVLSSLTELSTKYWLIAQKRFADLIEYTQTHDDRFAEEAQIVITSVSYNSPFNMDWKVDLSAPSVAEALVTTIDGVAQKKERLEKTRLENQARAQEIKEAEQKSDQENQAALLEREKQRLEIEQRRLEVLEKQLEVQKKGIEYALEIAAKVVGTLHPGADPATRSMEIQALLPNIIQFQNGKGVELVLPVLQIGEKVKNVEKPLAELPMREERESL